MNSISIRTAAFTRNETVPRQVGPQNPRDEPASEPLARIRTTREATETTSKANKKKPKEKRTKAKP